MTVHGEWYGHERWEGEEEEGNSWSLQECWSEGYQSPSDPHLQF